MTTDTLRYLQQLTVELRRVLLVRTKLSVGLQAYEAEGILKLVTNTFDRSPSTIALACIQCMCQGRGACDEVINVAKEIVDLVG
jgi:hypothetical protein